jgi:hypothetical protein
MSAMDRREFLGSSIAAGICSAGSNPTFSLAQNQGSPQEGSMSSSTPAWLSDGLVTHNPGLRFSMLPEG